MSEDMWLKIREKINIILFEIFDEITFMKTLIWIWQVFISPTVVPKIFRIWLVKFYIQIAYVEINKCHDLQRGSQLE